jgi:hypothetical protein
MKTYPKIDYWNKVPFGLNCIAFDKLDGSNVRFEWSHKTGWYKFGTRNQMINKSTPIWGKSIDIFLNKYADGLESVFRSKYKGVVNFVVFGEFWGESSFAGLHDKDDEMNVTLFDVNQYKRGFIPPNEFIDNFGHLGIPDIVYQGEYNKDLIQLVKTNSLNKKLSEGVIVKGLKQKEVWMTKIKTEQWLTKVKLKFGNEHLLKELNGDHRLLIV